MPDEAGYGEGFHKQEMGLTSPPRVDNYRGLYFLSFNRDAEDLYLVFWETPRSTSISFSIRPRKVGASDLGNAKVQRQGQLEKCFRSTAWTAIMCGRSTPRFLRYTESLGSGDPPPSPPTGFPGPQGRSLSLRNGHGVESSHHWRGRGRLLTGTPFSARNPKRKLEAARRLGGKIRGATRLPMCNTNRLMLIYPNFALHDIAGVSLRYFEPVGQEYMEVAVQTLAPHGESAGLLNRRLENFLSFLGPGGFAHPDDIEAMESAQLGFHAGGPQWVDASRGMQREATALDELHVRAFWRQWHANISGDAKADRYHDSLDGERGISENTAK